MTIENPKATAIPTSALTDITVPDVSQNPQVENVAASPISDADLSATKDHIKEGTTNLLQQLADGAKPPTTAIPPTNAAQGQFQPQQSGQVKLGDTIGGKRAADLLDAILPSVMVFVAFQLQYKIRKADLQMDADEKKLLAPALQDYLNSININLNNPLYNLLLVAGIIYGGKFMDMATNSEAAPKKIPTKAAPTTSEAKANPVPVKTNIDLFKEAAATLTADTVKKRKKGRQDAIDHLNKTGAYKKLKQQYNIAA